MVPAKHKKRGTLIGCIILSNFIMANYYVSGVVFSEEATAKKISHVSLHTCAEDIAVSKGILVAESEILRMIKDESHVIKTMRWDYENGVWEEGAKIIVDDSSGEEKLRCLKNATVMDCLENLIDLRTLYKNELLQLP